MDMQEQSKDRGFFMIMRRNIKELAFILMGSFFIAISCNVFLTPSKFSAGGVSTISTILFHLFGVKLSVSTLLINIVLFIFGYKYLGKTTILKTLAGIIFCSLCFELTTKIPNYYGDPIISSFVGGILMGIGVGLAVKVNASTGGSDFAALILKRLFPHISMATLILIIDFFIIGLAGVVFNSFTISVYSIISLYISSIVTDYILTLGDDAKMVFVFSEKSREISEMILKKFERGVTGVNSKGMYSKSDKLMLLSVISPKELPAIVCMIKQIDANAFVVINDVKEVLGEGFKTSSDYNSLNDALILQTNIKSEE